MLIAKGTASGRFPFGFRVFRVIRRSKGFWKKCTERRITAQNVESRCADLALGELAGLA
jgi:hypothetical protein